MTEEKNQNAEEAKAPAAAVEETKAEGTPKADTEKTLDELKAEAEAAEAAWKAARGTSKEDEIRRNMIRRRDKAAEKAQSLQGRGNYEDDDEPASENLDVRDLLALERAEIAEDSPKATVLAKYKAGGIITSYKDGLSHPAIQAEFAVLDAANKAATVIDESESDARVRTTKEVVSGYRATGNVPQDPKSRAAIAASNLDEMGL